jgi:hypothetical protein
MPNLKKEILIATLSGIMGALIVLVGSRLLQVSQADAQIIQKKEAIPYKESINTATLVASAKLPKPDYDSGWVSITTQKTLTHNLGGDVNNYLVDFQMKANSTGMGINNNRIGIDEYWLPDSGGVFRQKFKGAHWCKLTTTTIELRRGEDDIFSNKVRIRIRKYAKL